MRPITTFSMAVVLASLLAAPGFAAGGSEQALDANARNQAGTSGPTTTTPWSSSMSSPNTPSHDGNSQLGKNQGSSAAPRNRAGSSTSQTTAPSTSGMSSVDTPRWNRAPGQSAGTNPAATNPGCGGTC